MSKAGNWELKCWRGGYPVWVEVHFGDKEIVRIRHNDLRDLEYAVQQAMREAKRELPQNYQDEV